MNEFMSMNDKMQDMRADMEDVQEMMMDGADPCRRTSLCIVGAFCGAFFRSSCFLGSCDACDVCDARYAECLRFVGKRRTEQSVVCVVFV